MNRKAVLISGAAIVIVLLLTAGFVITHLTRNGQNTGTPQTVFPVSTTTVTMGNGTTPSSTMTITARNGSVLTTKDFIHNGQTISDTENQGNYLLAGSLGYCLPNAPCKAAPSTEFNILYSAKSQTLTVALLTEPLGAARKDAETFLLDALGISQQQLCSLNYYVGTTYQVNETYAVSNLGFSFCSGAVPLP